MQRLFVRGLCQFSPKLILHSSTNPRNFHSCGRWGCGDNLQLLRGKHTGGFQIMEDMERAGLRNTGYHWSPCSSEVTSTWGQTQLLILEILRMPLGTPLRQWDHCGAKCDRGFFAHDNVLRCEVLLDQHSLETESWHLRQKANSLCLSPRNPYQMCQTWLFLCYTSPFVACSMQPSSQPSHPVLVKPGSICTAVTVRLILLPYILILSTNCHKLLLVLSSLSFSLQNQVMLQQKSIPPQFEDQLLVIKGVTVVARQLPRPQFSSLSLISKTFKHMFTCRLMIISLRLARAMLFCLWFMDP